MSQYTVCKRPYFRQSSTLPWEKDAEFCVLNEELVAYDELFLKRAFWKKNLEIHYDSAEGSYIIKPTDHKTLKVTSI